MLLIWRWGRIKTVPMIACLTLLCLADMWDVNKRYLNDGMFSQPRSNEQSFPKSQADEIILQDATPYYLSEATILPSCAATRNSSRSICMARWAAYRKRPLRRRATWSR